MPQNVTSEPNMISHHYHNYDDADDDGGGGGGKEFDREHEE